MRLEILGSGGATTTPKPFCRCEACELARRGSTVDGRWGPAVFVHGPDVLVDTPEEISLQLNRSTVSHLRACLYSHWHPDHTSGKRVFEMNKDWVGLPAQNKTTQVIVTEKIAQTFGQFLGIASHFEFLAHSGLVAVKTIPNDGIVTVGDYTIEAIQLAEDYVFGYHFAGRGKHLLVIMDELKGWVPSARLAAIRFDLVYLPLGIVDVNPITGHRNIAVGHPILGSEQTVDETLAVVQHLNAARFVLSHIEEPDGITFAMGEQLARLYSQRTGQTISFAYDTAVYEL